MFEKNTIKLIECIILLKVTFNQMKTMETANYLQEQEQKTLGRLARILNPHRELNPYNRYSYLYLLPTNECNYCCACCYTDSQHGLKHTRLPRDFTEELIKEAHGIDQIILSGGEVSILPHIDEIILAAAENATSVLVYTNGSGFLDRSRITKDKLDSDTCYGAVLESLAVRFSAFPNNVEIALPVTSYHLQNNHPAHRFHRSIIDAGSELAHQWYEQPDKPAVRFIVKTTPGQPNSGNDLIKHFKLGNFGKTGAAFPGHIWATGRGINIVDAKRPIQDRLPGNEDVAFSGGVHVNYLGVYSNEKPMLKDLHNMFRDEIPDSGKICSLNANTTIDELVRDVENYLSALYEH